MIVFVAAVAVDLLGVCVLEAYVLLVYIASLLGLCVIYLNNVLVTVKSFCCC